MKKADSFESQNTSPRIDVKNSKKMMARVLFQRAVEAAMNEDKDKGSVPGTFMSVDSLRTHLERGREAR